MLQRINGYIQSTQTPPEGMGANDNRLLTRRTPLVKTAIEEADMLLDVQEYRRNYRPDRTMSVDVLRDYTPNIVISNTVSCSVPYAAATADRVVLSVIRYAASFTQAPFEHQVLTTSLQQDFNLKMLALESRMAQRIEQDLIASLETNKNTVWNNSNLGLAAQNGGSIDIVNNHILVTAVGRNTFLNAIPSFANANDLNGDELNIISSVNMNQNVQYVFNQGEQNAQNLAFQVQNVKSYATTNSLQPDIIAGNPAFATGYFFTQGSLGLLNLVDPNLENIYETTDGTIFGSTEMLPKSQLRMMYSFKSACADNSVASGLPSQTASPLEQYTFWTDLLYITQYNPDPTKSTSVFKYQLLN